MLVLHGLGANADTQRGELNALATWGLSAVGVDAPHPLVGILTRGDILSAHRKRLKGAREGGRHIRRRETLKRYTT